MPLAASAIAAAVLTLLILWLGPAATSRFIKPNPTAPIKTMR
jgi:hypothetical protein